ncbi:MAG TPA: glycosyltransferase family 9 protein, partial [Chloroflexota bacterium]|nr:glycosyltransferase family 9 protein [Chloroflexota bacterium]
PAVDRVRACRFPAFDRSLRRPGRMNEARARVIALLRAFETARALRGERFDAAVVLVADYWAAAVTALAGIPVRAGLAGGGAQRFLTHVVEQPALPVGKLAPAEDVEHVAASQLRVARRLLSLSDREPAPTFDARTAYEPTAADRADAARLWRKHELEKASGVAVIHPTPGAAAKRWPNERFAIVADHLSGRLGATVMLTGGPDDVDDVRDIAARCVRKPIDLAGQTSFGALAALFDRARLAIGPDNGAMHLATARGLPALRLFGPTDAQVWGGWAGDQPSPPSLTSPRVCSPCHRLDLPDWGSVPGARGDVYPCLADLTVDAVIEAVEHLWRESDGR